MYVSLLDHLEATARRFPDRLAFADPDSSATWKEFVAAAKARSSVLSQYFPPRHAVPVMLDKTVETLEYFFGALYSGCFYSFFDASFPESRLTSMLQTLQSDTIVTSRKYEDKVTQLPVKALYVEDLKNEFSTYDDTRRHAIIDTDPAYANFTSGSTGTPKAVLVAHRSVMDFLTVFTETFRITEEDRIANQAPFDFDVSVKDIFSAVFTGASVHLVPRAYFSMPTKLLDYLDERQITTLIWAVSALCIVSMLGGFKYKTPKALKKIMFSGEVMPPKQLKIWQDHYPEAEFVNLYGPTEITCNCTYYRIPGPVDGVTPVPAGKPFPNERVFLLDDGDHLVTTPDTEGEICVSGTCVALGYYHNDKTKEVFVQNPLQDAYFERIYRTGDLGKFLPDGNLFYIGRKDTQIKHMGHRIELGEIENALAKHEHVSRACCIFSKNKITAFYSGVETDKKELVSFLKESLPAWMVPTVFTYRDRFPLTKNGKIDRKALLDS